MVLCFIAGTAIVRSVGWFARQLTSLDLRVELLIEHGGAEYTGMETSKCFRVFGFTYTKDSELFDVRIRGSSRKINCLGGQ